MANRYWVGGTGTWDASDTTHWAATSGGASGASAPVAGDSVHFDANSFNTTGQTVTFAATAYTWFNSISFVGVTNNPDFKLTINAYANNWTFVEGMTFTPQNFIIYIWAPENTTVYFTSAGKSLYNLAVYGYDDTDNAIIEYLDDVNITNYWLLAGGHNKLNGHTLSAAFIQLRAYAEESSVTLDITNSVLNLTTSINGIDFADTTGFTLISEGSVINLTRVNYGQNFNCANTAGPSLYFDTVNFNNGGIGSQVRGSNTFNKLIFNAGKPVVFRPNFITTVIDEIEGKGSSGSLIPITSSVAGTPFTISKADGIVDVDYWDIKDCIATGGASFYAGDNSVDSGGNSGWIWSKAPTIILEAAQVGKNIVLNWFRNE